jgi:membrane fusion protein, copper/silver efflux system
MNNYRKAFWAALAANLALVAIIGGLWWRSHIVTSPQRIEVSASELPRPPDTSSEPLLAPMQLTPQRLQSIGVKTGEVRRQPVAERILTTGNVAVDETRLAYVQVRFSGYIQKVFVNATYQKVHKGQRLFTIYSPELLATEREYLLARDSQRALAASLDPDITKDVASLVDAAQDRLQQWSIPQREIARLQSGGPARQELEIDSPVSGYVTEREALPNKFAQPDTRLYTVADLSTIWVFAQVFQNDLGRLKVGDAATLTVDTYPQRRFSGRVGFIYPEVDMSTRTARVRLEFPNPAVELMPGMFVNVALELPMGEHEVIPASGILQSGTRQIAFVDHGGGNLEPREVQLGARVGDDFIVLKGLVAGERIVTSANFLIDSESQLQAALGTFTALPAGNATQTRIEFSTRPSPPRKGGNLIHVMLTAENGKPLVGAEVTVNFDMAAMPAMGMAATRVVAMLSDKGDGVYEGPAELGHGGTWQVTILAKENGQMVASQQLSVNATGGM